MRKIIICKFCGRKNTHYSSFCPQKPRKPIKVNHPIKKKGKQYIKWQETRSNWLFANPPDDYGYWYCHYCKTQLTLQTLTLDHLLNRSAHPHMRHALYNLVPCCVFDNLRKGSISYEKYCEKYYPELL